MTGREAKRIALRNIIEGIKGDLQSGADYWHTHPDTLEELSDADTTQVEKAALEVLDVLQRRVDRLRSCFTGRA